MNLVLTIPLDALPSNGKVISAALRRYAGTIEHRRVNHDHAAFLCDDDGAVIGEVMVEQ